MPGVPVWGTSWVGCGAAPLTHTPPNTALNSELLSSWPVMG